MCCPRNSHHHVKGSALLRNTALAQSFGHSLFKEQRRQGERKRKHGFTCIQDGGTVISKQQKDNVAKCSFKVDLSC